MHLVRIFLCLYPDLPNTYLMLAPLLPIIINYELTQKVVFITTHYPCSVMIINDPFLYRWLVISCNSRRDKHK